jgi:CubicO group peptidase (beta-lactamase class C family)
LIELDHPEPVDGAYAIDGSGHREGGGDPPAIGLGFDRLPDGRMRHDVASAQKSVVALLVGVAADLGLLAFDDAVGVHLGSGWSRASADHEDAVTLRHLLSMTSGLDDGLEAFAPPGAAWRYGLGPTWHLLKRVMVAASGLPLQQLTDEWLAAPLGLTDSVWEPRPGMHYLDGQPFEALSTTGRDLAAVGELVLRAGRWGDDQLLSAERIGEILTPSSALNPAYGLLWWLNGRSPMRVPGVPEPIDQVLLPHAPADTVAMLGALGQFCHVVPSLDAVVVRLGSAVPGPMALVGALTADDLWRHVLLPEET